MLLSVFFATQDATTVAIADISTPSLTGTLLVRGPVAQIMLVKEMCFNFSQNLIYFKSSVWFFTCE